MQPRTTHDPCWFHSALLATTQLEQQRKARGNVRGTISSRRAEETVSLFRVKLDSRRHNYRLWKVNFVSGPPLAHARTSIARTRWTDDSFNRSRSVRLIAALHTLSQLLVWSVLATHVCPATVCYTVTVLMISRATFFTTWRIIIRLTFVTLLQC